MAIIANRACKAVGTLHGGPTLARTYPEAAAQSFKKGEAVYLDGSGNVAVFTSAIDDGNTRFLGFAAEDGHNSTNAADSTCEVELGYGNIFEANVTSNGAAQVTAKTQVGSKYAMVEDNTNHYTLVDIANTATQIQCARILEIVGVVGDTGGRVRFTLDPAALQVTGS